MAGAIPAADWRDACAYAPLLPADRSSFAWEWLRRDPRYRATPLLPDSFALSAFGLHRYEPWDCDALHARPLWRSDADPSVLNCHAEPSAGTALDRFDIAMWPAMARVDRIAGTERVLLSDGLHAVRLDIVSGTVLDGPVALRFELHGLAGALPATFALRRLIALVRQGHFSAALHPPERRAARWVMALRVHDGLAAGASYRELAAALFGQHCIGPRWWLDTPSWGLRIQRLAVASRAALAAGPRPWLAWTVPPVSGSPAG